MGAVFLLERIKNMNKEVPLVTLGVFSPEMEDAKVPFGRLIKHFYGPAGEEFIQSVQQGDLPASARHDFRSRVDVHFFNALKDGYQFPDSVTPQTFYSDAGAVALAVVNHLADLTGLSVSHDPLADEVSPNPPSPTDLLYYLARTNQGVDPRLEYGIRRHIGLLHIAAGLESNSGNGVVRDVLSDLQFAFNEDLYHKGMEGHKEPHDAYTYHDPETNRFLGFVSPESVNNYRGANRILRHHFEARRIQDNGLVYTRGREKDLRAATEKAIAKAYDNGGVVRPEDVEDFLGYKAVLLTGTDNNESRDKNLATLVIHPILEALLKDSSLQPTDERVQVFNKYLLVIDRHRKIKTLVLENEVDKDRGQGAVNQIRGKIGLFNVPVPIEFIVTSEGDYYNQVYEVGEVNPQTGIHGGQAHDIYILRRSRKAVEVVQPQSISGVNNQAALKRRSREISEGLKAKDAIYSGVGVGGYV